MNSSCNTPCVTYLGYGKTCCNYRLDLSGRCHCSHNTLPLWIIAVLIAFGVIILILGMVCVYLLNLLIKRLKINKPMIPEIRGIHFIPFKVIRKATSDFSNSMILGEGGFGIVYKGISANGDEWAIKKAKVAQKHDLKTFRRELESLAQIHHRNIVDLIGYCLTTRNDQIIVFEFMAGGTLNDRLHSSNILLPNHRIKIALDVAEGISYIHDFTKTGIMHRDIKSDNILLNAKGIAKLSDFGISIPVPENKETDNIELMENAPNNNNFTVTSFIGTFGYLAPDLIRCVHDNAVPVASIPADTYAFGVVLFEIITGKRAIIVVDNIRHSLVSLVMPYVQQGKITDIIDERLLGINTNGLESLMEIAAKCCNDLPQNRPTMKTVTEEIRKLAVCFQK